MAERRNIHNLPIDLSEICPYLNERRKRNPTEIFQDRETIDYSPENPHSTESRVYCYIGENFIGFFESDNGFRAECNGCKYHKGWISKPIK